MFSCVSRILRRVDVEADGPGALLGGRAIGFDIDPARIRETQENIRKSDVGELAKVVEKDIFTQDLGGASVVTLYLLPSLNEKLIPQLQKLKSGSRIVSHDFAMEGVKPERVVEVLGPTRHPHHLSLANPARPGTRMTRLGG